MFIDEPEISLHPLWQQKVLDYYKAMFTDAAGVQTSQIFCVTHSPFVIHSNRRRDDKVIVMKRALTAESRFLTSRSTTAATLSLRSKMRSQSRTSLRKFRPSISKGRLMKSISERLQKYLATTSG